MSLKLTAFIEAFGDKSYLAYIDSIKGMVEHAETPEEAIKELLISLKVKMAYDLGIGLDGLRESVVVPMEEYCIEKIQLVGGKAQKELNLTVA